MIETLSTENLGYGQYSSETMYGSFEDDIRFNAGFGWPFANVILQTQQSGNSVSLFYTSTNGQISIGASGAISNYGPISDIADSLGFDLPVFDFDTQIFSPPIPRYTDSVFELQSPLDDTLSRDPNTRGNIFQVQFPNIDPGLANLEYFIEGVFPLTHGSRVISNWMEMSTAGTNMTDFNTPSLTDGINSTSPFGSKTKLHGGGPESFYTISPELGAGPHWYLPGEDGFRGSFVSLGDQVYIDGLEALAAGDMNAISDGILSGLQNWWSGQSSQISPPIDYGVILDNNMMEGLENVWDNINSIINPEDNEWLNSINQFNNYLGGASNDHIVNTMGAGTAVRITDMVSGFVDQITESIDTFIENTKSWVNDFLGPFGAPTLHANMDFLIPETSFVPTTITQNPELTELINLMGTYPNTQQILTQFNSLSSDSIGLVTENRAQIVYAGVTSKAPQYNPREISIPEAAPNETQQLPYGTLGRALGNNYTRGLTSKHPHPEDVNVTAAEGETPSPSAANYYPHSMGWGVSTREGGGGNLGDLKNLASVTSGINLQDAETKSTTNSNYAQVAEGEKYGMPFYFKDLRDNKYIIFRAYLEDINQELQPEWSEHIYLGRSEPAYVYSRTRRIINFAFKVHANTKPELQLIYEKLNYLQSLTYPRYHEDNAARLRMVPPLMSLRLGDLFGNKHRNLGGFLEALSYNWEQNSSWETTEGQRVPKTVTINCSFKVIHREPPSVATAHSEFLGVNLNTRTSQTAGENTTV